MKTKTLIVYNHPYEGSFCHALLEETIKTITHQGGDYEVIDLDKSDFNPVMTASDLKGFVMHQMVGQKAKAYSQKLQEADHLVMIFPIWWELMPALTKGFIDKVIFPGTAYDYTKSGYGMTSKLSKLKSVTIISTMNTPKSVYRLLYGNTLQRALVRGTFKKIRLKNVKWLSFNGVKQSSQKKRQTWLQKLSKVLVKRLILS